METPPKFSVKRFCVIAHRVQAAASFRPNGRVWYLRAIRGRNMEVRPLSLSFPIAERPSYKKLWPVPDLFHQFHDVFASK